MNFLAYDTKPLLSHLKTISESFFPSSRGAIILAKLSIVPVRRGFWGNKIGKPHTVPCKVTGKCGSIWVRLIPAPRGTGIVSAPVPKKLLQMAGIEDCYTSARGSTGTLGNFGEFFVTFRHLHFAHI